MSGISTPARAAISRLSTIAAPMISASRRSSNQAAVTAPTTTAHSSPLSSATASSLAMSQRTLALPSWPSAMLRTTSVSVWLPAMPPMLATMGISTASATTFSSVSWNRPTTQEARKAVARLTPSHTARRRAAGSTGAKVSSSSDRPVRLMRECSDSSRMTSTTSSMVMRPRRRPSASTTGADTRSRSSKRLATSVAGMSAGMGSSSRSMTSATVSSGGRVRMAVSGSAPT